MKKIGSWFLLFVLISGVIALAFLLFDTKSNEEPKTVPTELSDKAIEEKYEEVSFEGYLSKEGDKFVTMGWELKGNSEELEKALNHMVKVEGHGKDFVLEVDTLTVTDEMNGPTEEVIELEGVLQKKGNDYLLNDYILTGEFDFSSHLKETVYLFAKKTSKENVLEVVELNEAFVLKGTLEYVAGEPPDIHYTLEGTDFDIHHNIEIFEQEGKELELLVYAKSHGVYVDDKHVTLIRILK